MTSDTNNTYIWEATNEELIAELRRRGGYTIAPIQMWSESMEEFDRRRFAKEPDAPQPVRNTAPEEKWLEVIRLLQQADRASNLAQWSLMATFTRAAVWQLFELLEPPSVRERRMNGG